MHYMVLPIYDGHVAILWAYITVELKILITFTTGQPQAQIT